MNFHTLFSEREHEIISLICVGLKSHEIAKQLFLSSYTVKDYRKTILQKLQAKNVAHMVHICHQQHLI